MNEEKNFNGLKNDEGINNLNSNTFEEKVEEANIENPILSDEIETKKKKNIKLIVLLSILLLIGIGVGIYLILNNKNNIQKPDELPNHETKNEEKNEDYLAYKLTGNSISDFDLYFLKLENNGKNKVYSPLSIKYALEMLHEGANGKTKEQIANIIGEYSPKKYPNNKNMSFANAMFIKNSYKDFIKSSYKDNLIEKFNAEVIYDSFDSPDKVNSWVSDKTFKLINGLVNDISDLDFILVNALAIDMEWVNKIQPEDWSWGEGYIHEDYSKFVQGLSSEGGEGSNYYNLKFNSKNVASVEVGALINKYDIVKDMGEEKIRKIVGEAYQKWLDEDAIEESCEEDPANEPDVETFLKSYLEELNGNYKKIDASTDFSFYIDDNVKVFVKDLKEYEGTTLEYIGIMPTKMSLTDYINNLNADKINGLLNNIKPFALESFAEGKITDLTAYIPMFNYNYELNLMSDLNKLGITNIFDENKADLSNLTSKKAVINKALHKSTIEFSNSGIKAAAVTLMGGAGAGECGFDYIFEIPKSKIEKIDLTFNKPYLYLIIDKKTKEVWFAGSVYEPSLYDEYVKNVKFESDWEDDYE